MFTKEAGIKESVVKGLVRKTMPSCSPPFSFLAPPGCLDPGPPVPKLWPPVPFRSGGTPVLAPPIWGSGWLLEGLAEGQRRQDHGI